MIFDSSQFLRRLLAWFDCSRRDLPWRLPREATADDRLDPYRVLVSEAMLQQTQVSTVVPYFNRFCAAFPTLQSLAESDEQAVLRLWQGLGYYSRARNLRRTAQKVVSDFAGVLPDSVDALLTLPGIGRYTAGAIASIAYNRPAPILDGNVSRVLCRIDRIETDPRDRVTQAKLWERAAQLLPPDGRRVGDFNSALMELGALLCTPRNPQCLLCPVNRFCQAYIDGVQYRIPVPRKAKPTPLVKRWTFLIRRGSKYLIEQRPQTGRWAGLWQFVTIAPTGKRPGRPVGTVRHTLTHRRYHFDVFVGQVDDARLTAGDRPRVWVRPADLHRYPLPVPHLKIAGLLDHG
jgi:A/G-specific adenine glycosylase